MPDNAVWAASDDAEPAISDFSLASGDPSAACNPRYRDFIDFIVLDRRAAADYVAFDEATFAGAGDHCAISARLTLR